MKKIVLSKRFLAMLLVMLMAGQMLMPSLALAEGEWVSEVSDQIQTAKYYGVQFVVDGTDFTKLNVEAGFTLKTLPEAPAKEGYIFLGWMGEDGIPFSTKTVVNGDMRITARYAVQESMPESSLFTFEDRGDYTSVAFEGTYMNEAPTVRRIDGFAVEDGEITYRVLEAWGMKGLKEATAGNVQTMLDAWGVENQGTGFIARLTITALPEADTTQSYSVFSMNGNQLGDVIARNVAVGDVVELPLTYDLDNGIALVEISDDALIAYSRRSVWSNSVLYLTGRLPVGAVVEAEPVNGVVIDGREALVAYDIKIYASEERRAQGKTWQPADKKIKVHFFNKDFAGQTLEVYHIPETKNAEPELVETIEGAKSDWVSFDAEHFSVYAVVEGVTPEARMTVNFCDKDGDIIATMYVKNSDTRDKLNAILFDPGAGELEEGETFRGWVIGDIAHAGSAATLPEYNVDMATAENTPDLLTIEEIRNWAAAFDETDPDNHITEGDVVNIRAAIYKIYVITYLDPDGIAQSADSKLAMPDQTDAYAYTINQSYTPTKETLRFDGWEPTEETASNITEATQHDEGVLYQKDDEIEITGNVDFVAKQTLGHYVVYHENGKGGTYVAPDFVVHGEETVEPTITMLRNGYEFAGWYKGVTGEEDEHGHRQVTGDRYGFGESLDDYGEGKLHLYADWTPKTTAPYTVICWTQNANRTGYNLEHSYVGEGTVGQPIPFTFVDNTDEDYVTGVGSTQGVAHGHYTGFTLKHSGTNQLGNLLDDHGAEMTVPNVTPEGDAVLNLYFDRIVYNLRFYMYRRATNGQQQYSYATQSAAGRNTWGIAGNWINVNENSLPTTTYGNGTLQQSAAIDNYRGYYFVLSAYYGEDISSRWPTYDQLKGPNNDATKAVSFIMMNGTGLKGNSYNGNGYGDGRDTIKGQITVMDKGILGLTNNKDGNFLIIRYASYNDWTYHIYYECLPGVTYENKVTKTINGVTKDYYFHHDVTSRSSNTIADNQNPPAYQGFEVVTTNGTDEYNDGYGGNAPRQDNITGYTCYLNYYYNRLNGQISYMDGAYFDGNGNIVQGNGGNLLLQNADLGNDNTITQGESAPIPQGAVIADAYKEWVPSLPAGESGYVFGGWYADAACTTPMVDGSIDRWGTMPDGGIQVHAKWQAVEYRVFLKPNLPEDIVSSTEAWGSEQSLSFRRPYNGTVSLPQGNANLEKYEFAGWYTTPTFETGTMFTEDDRLNESLSALQDYDKTVDMTDPLDFRTGDAGSGAYNSDAWDPQTQQPRDRWWITKKLVLYAKWREVLPGAPGINVVYDAGTLGDSTTVPEDDTYYADQSKATAQAGCAPQDSSEYQFEYWVVQKWNGTAFEDTNVKVYPGDTFDVLKANAHEEAIPEDQIDPSTGYNKKYTVQLRAEYKPVEDPTPTHIWWYNNYDAMTVVKANTIPGKEGTVENMAINEGVNIKPANTFTPHPQGYTFVGWARVPNNVSGTVNGGTAQILDYATVSQYLYLKYEDGVFKLNDSTSSHNGETVTLVAADEESPYHDMYAVWEPFTKVPVEKVWNSGDFEDQQPESVTVELLRNGVSFSPDKKTVVLSEDNEWKHTFEDLPTRDDDNHLITYTIVETEINDGWAATYAPEDGVIATTDGKATATLKVTNTPTYGKITLKKTISGLPDALVSELDNVQFYVEGPKQADDTYKNTYGPYTLSEDFTLSEGTYTLAPEELAFVELGDYIYYEGGANILTDWGYELTATAGTTEANPVTITLDEAGTAEGSIANAYERVVGDLVINKTVTGDPLPAAYATGKFPYTVKIQNSKGWWLKGTGTTSDKYDLTNVAAEAGVYEITNTGTLRLEDIPIGTYTVIEQGIEENGSAQIENYTLAVTYTTNPVVVPKDTTGQSGTIGITNTYIKQVGTLSVSKVTDPDTIQKTFKFTVMNSEGKCLYPVNAATNEYGFRDNPYEFEATSNGAAVLFVDIPVDTYTVTEVIDGEEADDQANVQVDGYRYDGTVEVSTDVEVKKTHTEQNPATVTITNKYTHLIDVTVTKVWDDQNNTYELRPGNLTLTLNQNGAAMTGAPTPTVTASEDGNSWTYTWSNVPETDANGTAYTYTISEGSVPSGYSVSGSPAQAGGEITNTLDTIDIDVEKVWDDKGNTGLVHPALTITLTGKAGETEVVTKTFDIAADATGTALKTTWEDLPEKYNGTEITYTVAESEVPGYTGVVTGDKANGFTVTNTKDVATAKIGKTVSGNMGDVNKGFTFTVTLSDSEGALNLTEANIGTATGTASVNADGTLTLTLTDGQNVKLINLPTGVSLTVAETNGSEYKTTLSGAVTKTEDTKTATFDIAEVKDYELTFDNYKNTEVDTGVKLDFLPYVTILGIAGLGLIAMMIKRRRKVSR